ncbi:MAG: DUF4328 domain-containing protein [Actinomycetota bacterium]
MATFCTSCGADIQEGWRFCGVCGAPVPGAEAEQASPVAADEFAPPGDTTTVISQPPPALNDPARYASPLEGTATVRPAFERRGLRMLGGWTEGVTWLVALIQLPALGFALQQRSLFDDFQDDGSFSTFDDLVDAEDAWIGLTGFWFLLSIASIVLLMIWLYRVYGQTQSLGATDHRLPRGFTIGAWFIPFANFVLLSLLFSDLDRTTRSERVPIGRKWRETSTALIVWIWTATAVGSFVAFAFTGGTEENEFDVTLDDLDTVINARVAQNVMVFVTTAALAWYVRRVRANTDRVTALTGSGSA